MSIGGVSPTPNFQPVSPEATAKTPEFILSDLQGKLKAIKDDKWSTDENKSLDMQDAIQIAKKEMSNINLTPEQKDYYNVDTFVKQLGLEQYLSKDKA